VDALIKQLAEAWGPTGYEHAVRELIRAEVEPLADAVRVDPLGNLIAEIGSGPTRVMTTAHMDEIGLIISHIDRQGYGRFAPVGGLYTAALLGARVRFENGVIGTVGVDAQHTNPRELPTANGYFVDFSTGEANGGAVRVGDPAAFVGEVVTRGDRVIGKSLDDRAGCALLIEALRRVRAQGTPHHVFFVFTVQEEVGGRGAGPAAYGIDPHLALVVDCTGTGDTPKGRPLAVTLGGGAAIKVRDARLLVPPAVRDLLIERAEAAGIPYQLEVLATSGTDGQTIHVARAGVPTGVISFPMRYIHTTAETADRRDLQAALDLLTAALTGPLPGFEAGGED